MKLEVSPFVKISRKFFVQNLLEFYLFFADILLGRAKSFNGKSKLINRKNCTIFYCVALFLLVCEFQVMSRILSGILRMLTGKKTFTQMASIKLR